MHHVYHVAYLCKVIRLHIFIIHWIGTRIHVRGFTFWVYLINTFQFKVIILYVQNPSNNIGTKSLVPTFKKNINQFLLLGLVVAFSKEITMPVILLGINRRLRNNLITLKRTNVMLCSYKLSKMHKIKVQAVLCHIPSSIITQVVIKSFIFDTICYSVVLGLLDFFCRYGWDI